MGRRSQQPGTQSVKIAIASGKGGTGKTTVSAALAHIWPQPVTAVDLDVEEPNLHLFLKPVLTRVEKAYIDVPVVDESACNFCRACAELCQFKAISILGSVALVFSDMCHGCGGCMAVCPTGAIGTDQRELGEVAAGTAGDIEFLMGRLRVGEAMSPPLMRTVKAELERKLAIAARDVIIDCPPGVSCPAVNAVMDTDIIVMVTEPTPFGLYDLRLAHQAFGQLNIPMVVVINRNGLGDNGVEAFCRERSLPIAARIPYNDDIARTYSQGRIITESAENIRQIFNDLADILRGGSGPSREVRHD
jgi:MinD superfamily P-loop ATPase